MRCTSKSTTKEVHIVISVLKPFRLKHTNKDNNMTTPYVCGTAAPDPCEYESQEHHDATCQECLSWFPTWTASQQPANFARNQANKSV